jgi:hypothetical protein
LRHRKIWKIYNESRSRSRTRSLRRRSRRGRREKGREIRRGEKERYEGLPRYLMILQCRIIRKGGKEGSPEAKVSQPGQGDDQLGSQKMKQGRIQRI